MVETMQDVEVRVPMIEVMPAVPRMYAPSPVSPETLVAIRQRLREISAEFHGQYGLSIQSMTLVGVNTEPPVGVEIGVATAKVWDYRMGKDSDAFELLFNLTEMFA